MPTRTLSISFTLSVTALIFLLYAPYIWPSGVRAKQTLLTPAWGANVLSFMLNDTTYKEPAVQSALSLDNDFFYLSIWMGDQYKDRIVFVVNTGSVKPGTYELSNAPEGYVLIEHHTQSCEFQTDNYYSGTLTVSAYDPAKKIIAGSFEFLAHSSSCGELLKVSHGAFDVQYSNY